jgi:hypothetical protein
VSEEIANQVMRSMSDLFLSPSTQAPVTKTPCLVCGRHTIRALRIHPSCEAKAGPEEAERLRAGYFKNWRTTSG